MAYRSWSSLTRIDVSTADVTHYMRAAYIVETVIRWPPLICPSHVSGFSFPRNVTERPYGPRSEQEIKARAQEEAAREAARAKSAELRIVVESRREAKFILAKSRTRTAQHLRTVRQLRRELTKARLIAATAQDLLKNATAVRRPR
jgi:hypothetical protein